MKKSTVMRAVVFSAAIFSGLALAQEAKSPDPLKQTMTVQGYTFRYPDGWQTKAAQSSIALSPDGGLTTDASGAWNVRCGMLVEIYTRTKSMWAVNPTLQSRWVPGRKFSFPEGVEKIRKAGAKTNLSLVYLDNTERTFKVSGRQAHEIEWQDDHGSSGPERGVMLFLEHDAGILRWVFVAPKADFENQAPVFRQVINSIAPEHSL